MIEKACWSCYNFVVISNEIQTLRMAALSTGDAECRLRDCLALDDGGSSIFPGGCVSDIADFHVDWMELFGSSWLIKLVLARN